MAKRSILRDYAELREAAMEVFKMGPQPPQSLSEGQQKKKWAALGAALKLPPWTLPGTV